MLFLRRGLFALFFSVNLLGAVARAQDSAQPAPPADTGASPDGGVSASEPADADAAVPPEGQPSADAPPVEPPRGDTPVSVESIVNPEAAKPPLEAAQPPAAPPKEKEKEKPGKPRKEPEAPPPAPTVGPLVVWTTAAWGNALGPAHCGPQGIEGTELAVKIASTLRRSSAVAGLGVAAAGALSDHPLIAWAAREQPAALADLIAAAGFTAISIGIADVNGPLFRDARLANELKQRGVAVLASNFACAGQDFCEPWLSAEESMPIFERNGRRYAYVSLLPDDLLARVEPAGGRRFELRSAADTLVQLTQHARQAGAELIVASIDHGPDASVNVANFVSPMPPEVRPDLLLSPSAGDSLLFLRPLDVQPAIVGARPGVLMGIRVTKIENKDSDVLARTVGLAEPEADLVEKVHSLGEGFCKALGAPLPGGQLDSPLEGAELVQLAGNAVRQRADADLAVVDPLVYDASFKQPAMAKLQRGQMQRAVLMDSPLVTANVTLDWLTNLNKVLAGVRPLALIGTGTDRGDAVIAGRIPVIGATYRVVTTDVLARSKRLPDGPSWTPLDEPGATLRGALLSHLEAPTPVDPRQRLKDPADGTQWVLRADGQVQTNITEVDNPRIAGYDEPALQVNDSQQLGARLSLNFDADAPKFLFENALQVAFDRNFTTKTTAQDLIFLQTTYTYRGLWPEPFFYPHPFVEGYFETEFTKGDARYHHLLLRPKAGLRSLLSRVLSFKLSAGFQYEALQPNAEIRPGLGAELVLKPWTVALSNGTVQLEGNVFYYWNSPGVQDQHTLRAQLISAVNLIGPLQLTLTALFAVRKDPEFPYGKGLGLTAGVRLRFVDRTMTD